MKTSFVERRAENLRGRRRVGVPILHDVAVAGLLACQAVSSDGLTRPDLPRLRYHDAHGMGL